MRKHPYLLLFIFFVSIAQSGLADAAENRPIDTTQLPHGVQQVDIFLLLGQSNMRGRGALPDAQQMNPLILNMNLKDREWYLARHPLHMSNTPDLIDGSGNAGVGPGLSFAESLVCDSGQHMIALVPAARGGSWISLWQPERELYVEAIDRARKALADFPPGTARIQAVLWLQGESDARDDRYQQYAERLANLIESLRRDLQQPDLPFIACTIGSFIPPQRFSHVAEINQVLLGLPDKIPFTATVDARDLDGHIGDRLHYNSASQEVIGQRFAETYRVLIKASR
jgi:hypothetical protein